MKKIILIVVSFVTSIIFANGQDIETLFNIYKNTKGVESIKVAPQLLKGAAKIVAGLAEFNSELTEQDKEGLKLLESIEEVQFVVANRDTMDFRKELEKSKFLKKNKYQMLMETTDDKKEIQMYSQNSRKKDVFSDLLVVITDRDDNGSLLASIKGEIDPEDVVKLIELVRKETKNCEKK